MCITAVHQHASNKFWAANPSGSLSKIVAPEAAIGDLSSRRGHITGTSPRPGNTASITGEVPLAEITDYASRLKSLTGGQGSFSIEFARHAQVPPQIQQKLAASFRPKEEDE